MLQAIIHYWQQMVDPTSTVYGFWSGAGSDLGELTLLFALYHFFAVSRCHYGGEGFRGCRRHGRFDFKDSLTGVTYKLCRKHHPADPKQLNAEHVKLIHNRNERTRTN